MPTIFISGGTGYIGTRLINILLKKNADVLALVRKGSESKLPAGTNSVVADPFLSDSFASRIPRGSIFVQLLGVSHPGPKKKELFRTIDLASAKASANAAKKAGVAHFVYVSVAQTPTKIMKDYQACRAEGEAYIESTGLSATFIRPWYVVGPGHYWPLLFSPIFKLLELFPATAKKARSLRLVSLSQMLQTLVFAIEHPVDGTRIFEISEIKNINAGDSSALAD
ncbi:MAG: SDR family oxidoreductase [Chitinophagales bacterium]